MALLSLVLILICLSGNINALSCVQYTDTVANFTLEAAKEIINKQLLVDGYAKCAIDIRFHYDEKYIKIKFSKAFESTIAKINREVRVDTSISIADGRTILNPARIETSVEFVCDYADECDRHFVLGHLDWLFKANYDQLMSVIRSLLLTHNNKTGRNHLFISLL
jgi:hypothetical protein